MFSNSLRILVGVFYLKCLYLNEQLSQKFKKAQDDYLVRFKLMINLISSLQIIKVKSSYLHVSKHYYQQKLSTYLHEPMFSLFISRHLSVCTRAANYMHAKLCLLTCNDRSLRRYFTYFTFYNNKRRKNYIKKTPDSGGLI